MPFSAFQCLTPPMGVMPATDLFQARMVHFFMDMWNRWPSLYIDNILHFKGQKFDKHLPYCKKVGCKSAPRRIASAKNHWIQLNCMGYKPHPSRVDAILHINAPENIKQICDFPRIINFIKTHISKWADICKPMTRLTRMDINFSGGKTTRGIQ